MHSKTKTPPAVFDELKDLVTEQPNPKTGTIDTASVAEILKLINDEDATVHEAVKKELGAIEAAVNMIVKAFKKGGRLFYIGAGTSGRLGVLDASECPPTFGSDHEMVQGIIAGGNDALVRSKEGVEDQEESAVADLKSRGLQSDDVLCALTASRRTPYVLSALKYARDLGAKTIFVTCTPRNGLKAKADVSICPVTGPEIIMGSTRMKAGTAQKMVLNMLTTASFIRLGKVYKNMMIDLQMNSEKLKERSKRVLMLVTGVEYETADEYLRKSDGHVKTAIVMILGKMSRDNAVMELTKAEGFVRIALQNLGVKTI